MLTEKQRMNLLLHADDMEVSGQQDDAKALRALLAAHNAGAQKKGAGMQAQVIASRICSALEADADEGYDLEAGMFGKALSALIRELAAMTLSAGAQGPDSTGSLAFDYAHKLISERLGTPNASSQTDVAGDSKVRGYACGCFKHGYSPASECPECHPQPITDAARDGAWHMVCGDWRDEKVAIHGPNGHIASGLTIEQARAIIDAHGGKCASATAEIERLDRAKGE